MEEPSLALLKALVVVDKGRRFSIKTRSADETTAVGFRLARLLKRGDVLALEGGFGSGKTTFVKGLARGLGVDRDTEATSPSFVLVHEYTGKIVMYHIDCYRLKDTGEALAAGLEEFFYMEAIVAVEWADRIRPILPLEVLTVKFGIEGAEERSLVIKGESERIAGIREAFNRYRFCRGQVSKL